MLQGGNPGNSELPSGMEARLGSLKGLAKEDGIEHDCFIHEAA